MFYVKAKISNGNRELSIWKRLETSTPNNIINFYSTRRQPITYTMTWISIRHVYCLNNCLWLCVWPYALIFTFYFTIIHVVKNNQLNINVANANKFKCSYYDYVWVLSLEVIFVHSMLHSSLNIDKLVDSTNCQRFFFTNH